MQVLNISTGQRIRTFGEMGTGLGQFTGARKMCVTKDDKIYITDANQGQGRINVYQASGTFLHCVGRLLKAPMAVAVTDLGEVYVCEMMANRITVLE
jgi:hypothetical protein